MDRLNRQVNIQIRPIEVVRLRALDVEYFDNLSIFELGALGARTHQSFLINQHQVPGRKIRGIGSRSDYFRH